MNRNQDIDDVGVKLEEAVQAFQPNAATRQELRRRLAAATARNESHGAPTSKSGPRFRLWGGLASTIAAAAAVVMMVTGPKAQPLTWQDVRDAVQNAAWVKATFEDGETTWLSPRHDISARIGADGYKVFIDYTAGDLWCLFPFSKWIEHDSIDRRDLGPTVWESIVGPLERKAEAEKDTESRWWVERETEVVGGLELQRFDGYFQTAFGEKELVSRLWADPETRRPTRVERRKPGTLGKDGKPVWRLGIYTFPEEGPRSIFDLSVAKDVPIHSASDAEADATVVATLDAVDAALGRFPAAFRSIAWEPGGPAEIDVLHWSGRPTLSPRPDGTLRSVHTPVRLRSERYFDLGAPHDEYTCDDRSSGEAVYRWTTTQTPTTINLWDGETSFTQSGPLPSPFKSQKAPTLAARVSPTGDLYFSSHHWPSEVFWPAAHAARTADWSSLENTDEEVPGAVALRWDRGEIREDFYIDLEHDSLCVKHVRSRQVDGDWSVEDVQVLSELAQVAGGAWVARAIETRRLGHVRKWRLEVTPVAKDALAAELFDGDVLVEKARANDWEVSTW